MRKKKNEYWTNISSYHYTLGPFMTRCREMSHVIGVVGVPFSALQNDRSEICD